MTEADQLLLAQAVRLARNAAASGGHPYGAIIARDGRIIVAAQNATVSKSDPTAHAEIEAIRGATRQLGTTDLSGCTLYTTCEPCSMCAGAIFWSRISKVVVGTRDVEFGDLTTLARHGVTTLEYADSQDCANLLRDAKRLWMDEVWRQRTTVSQERRLLTSVYDRPSEVFQLFERQTLAVETEGNYLLALNGILIAITAAGLFTGSPRSLWSRIMVAAGAVLALSSSGVVINRIFRFRWASKLAASQSSNGDIIGCLERIRDRKTRFLDVAIYLVAASVLCYTVGIILLLF